MTGHKICTYRTWSRTDEDVYNQNIRQIMTELPCEPDEWDQQEGLTAVILAVRVLAEELYVTKVSAFPWQFGAWYCRTDRPDSLAPDGATHEELTAHLDGFTPAEEREVYELLRERGALVV